MIRSHSLSYKENKMIESVVEFIDRNVLYRGISNRLKISVPESKSFIVEAEGLRKTNGQNNYIINNTRNSSSHTKLHLKIITKEGDTLIEERLFKNVDIMRPEGIINGYGCAKCIVKLTKDELKNGEIGVRIPNYALSDKIMVIRYKIKFPNKEAREFEGNQISSQIVAQIDSLNMGEMVQIFDISIRIRGMNYKLKKVSNIPIQLIAKN
jgi:hypothetical protein